MNNLSENDAFFVGVATGIDIYQRKIIEAHKRKEPLMIGDTLYYLSDGRERLEEMLDKICQ